MDAQTRASKTAQQGCSGISHYGGCTQARISDLMPAWLYPATRFLSTALFSVLKLCPYTYEIEMADVLCKVKAQRCRTKSSTSVTRTFIMQNSACIQDHAKGQSRLMIYSMKSNRRKWNCFCKNQAKRRPYVHSQMG